MTSVVTGQLSSSRPSTYVFVLSTPFESWTAASNFQSFFHIPTSRSSNFSSGYRSNFSRNFTHFLFCYCKRTQRTESLDFSVNVGMALSAVGSSVVEFHASPCLCMVDSNSMARKQFSRASSLGSSFLDSWHDWRVEAKALSTSALRWSPRKRPHKEGGGLAVVSELGGQYEDSFEDVKTQMLNYFTYKAVRTVLTQLYEMNPTHYRWFYDFVAENKPGDGKHFIRNLGKERHDLAERVMVTRLHLYGKWIKKCDHAKIYKEISDENLELMRERLIETVIWPTDDTNTEKIG